MKSTKASPYKTPLILLSILLAVTVGVLIAIWVIFGAQKPAEENYQATTFAMGTYVNQTVYGSDHDGRIAATAAANEAVTELDNQISWRKSNSAVQTLNNNAGTKEVTLDSFTASVLATALDVAEKTGGAYDPTILPLSLLWNFDESVKAVPEAAEIQNYLQYVGYTNLRADPETGKAYLAKEHAAVDLGAIGKGAACDAAINAYKESEITHGIIAVGGSVGIYGTKPDGSEWLIGLRNPNSTDANASMGTLSIEGGFVSTSGTYERYFEENGILYHHILDPKTGYPADTQLVSVTVHCDNGALSDALSTACTVLGVEKSMPLLEAYNADAVFITNENKVIVTDGLKDCLTITEGSFTLQS